MSRTYPVRMSWGSIQMHTKANGLVEAAKSLVGTRYRHQGRNEAGLDCAGLMIVAAKMCGIDHFDTTNYSNRPNAAEFTREMLRAECTQIPLAELGHGDLLRLNTAGWPVHIAIYEVDEAGQEWYIHAFLPHRKVTRDPLTPVVQQSISSVWRFPE